MCVWEISEIAGVKFRGKKLLCGNPCLAGEGQAGGQTQRRSAACEPQQHYMVAPAHLNNFMRIKPN